MEPAAPVCLTVRPFFFEAPGLKPACPPPPKKKKKKNRKQSKAKKDRGESTGKQEENAGDSQNSAGSAPKIRRQALGEPTNLLWTAALGSTGGKNRSGYFINRLPVCKSRRFKSAAPGQPRFVSGPSRHRARRPARARAKLLGGERGVCRGGKQKSGPAGLKRAPSVNAR